MPLAAAGVGFGVTVVLLGGLWALMCYTALLLLEVYQHVPADTGLGSLAARYLGRYGQWITGFSMMFLMYALTAAYISGAGELIASSINDGFGASLSPETGAIVFTLIGGGVVCAGTSLVDLFNRFLFSAKILFLVVMLVLLAPHVHKVNLLFERGYSQAAPRLCDRQRHSVDCLPVLADGDAGQYWFHHLYRPDGRAFWSEWIPGCPA